MMMKYEFITAYVLARASALESMDSTKVVQAAFNAWDKIQEGLNQTTEAYQ